MLYAVYEQIWLHVDIPRFFFMNVCINYEQCWDFMRTRWNESSSLQWIITNCVCITLKVRMHLFVRSGLYVLYGVMRTMMDRMPEQMGDTYLTNKTIQLKHDIFSIL